MYAAVLCYLATKNKFYPKAYLIDIAAYAAYGLYLFFDKTGVLNWAQEHHGENIAQTMKATKPWIEETREFFGLIILIAVLLIDWKYFKKNEQLSQCK